MEIKPYFARHRLALLLSALLLISICLNLYIYFHYSTEHSPKFAHLAPDIAWLNVQDFLNVQNKYSIQFYPLKTQIVSIVNASNIKGHYGIYFEDLSTSAWIGINEKETFIPASLLKVPVMVAVLKKVETGDISLNQNITLISSDLDSASGSLAYKGAGYTLTVQRLLVYLVKESDNTALNVFHREVISDSDLLQAWLAMGLPLDGNTIGPMGPKQYSNILRSLYYSAYLRRDFSEMALSLMSETDYSNKIPAGVPLNIPISHKVGFIYGTDGFNIYHDCGIIYHPVKPYILCIMSKDATDAESTSIMSNVSRTIYNYVDNLSKQN